MSSIIDLTCSIAGIPLSNPLFNASGVSCTTEEQLNDVISSPFSGAVVTKSCTITSRTGNPLPRYAAFSINATDLGSINSMGLPNNGLVYYIEAARNLQPQKPYFVSLCGLTRAENLQMLSTLQYDCGQETPISGVELNLSCPNVPGKPQTGYDFDATEETLRQSLELFDRLPLGVKLPPYFDPAHWDRIAGIIERQKKIGWVTCINSPGNGLVIDPIEEQVLIAPKSGHGGIGGALIKPWALSNVRAMRTRLPQSIDVIGCGGVTRGLDVFEHILCGASAVQVGTLLHERGTDCFRKLTEELTHVMLMKGYNSLSDFHGNLKTLEQK